MNNKASKRLLAASVASLMLVVAFCGFTYAGDDADAEGNGSATTPYVKNVIIATGDGDTDSSDGDVVEFKITTTQYVVNEGSGIDHSGTWFFESTGNHSVGTEYQEPVADSNVMVLVNTNGNVHTFKVKADINAPINTTEEVTLRYVLTSTVDGKGFTQTIYYIVNIDIVRALPNVVNDLNTITGYVGVESVWDAEDWAVKGSDTVISNGDYLKFYASNLPNGLSMNIDGTISGVPKISGTHTAIVKVYNETGIYHEFKLTVTVEDRIASLDAYVTEKDTVKKVDDDRYIVVQGTAITVNGQVTGFRGGSMSIDSDDPATTYSTVTGLGTEPVTLTETGERLIKVAYTFDMDDAGSMPAVEIVDYITVVVIDVVEDATTGMGLVAGSVPSTNVPYTPVTS